MTIDDYNAFCRTLPHTHHVVQWEGAHVWKVGSPAANKMFAIAGNWHGEVPFFTFKCSPMSYELLKELPGVRPAPYLASRGMLWLQRHEKGGLDDAALCDYLRESHRLASLNLTRKLQRELGLNAG
jgi:predicted DNA-binding protein (MmcQ/YjbR family)